MRIYGSDLTRCIVLSLILIMILRFSWAQTFSSWLVASKPFLVEGFVPLKSQKCSSPPFGHIFIISYVFLLSFLVFRISIYFFLRFFYICLSSGFTISYAIWSYIHSTVYSLSNIPNILYYFGNIRQYFGIISIIFS